MAKHPRHQDDEVLNREDEVKDRFPRDGADAPLPDPAGTVTADPYTPMTPPGVPLNAPVLRDAAAVAAEEVAALYAKFKPEAAEAYLTFFLARTPAEHQEAMKATIAADLETPPGAPVPDPNVATVSGGQSITVVAADGTTVVPGSPGAARVLEGVLADVQLAV